MKYFGFKHKELDEMDRKFMEKALQLYFFFKHVNTDNLNDDLAERFRYNQQVVYSLIRSYLTEDRFAIEYMDHLNDELKKIDQLDESALAPLSIKPKSVGEIQLKQNVPVVFNDDEEHQMLEMSYFTKDGMVFFRFLDMRKQV
jgi:predicted RND superfamily exporter protein